MRRASITLTDDLEALVDRHIEGLAAPPSLNVLVQAALRSFLGVERGGAKNDSRDRGPFVGEQAAEYGAEAPAAVVALDPETELALRQVAAREGVTPSELAATVLREYVRGVGRPPPPGVGGYRSGRSDVSSRAEELLRAAARAPSR